MPCTAAAVPVVEPLVPVDDPDELECELQAPTVRTTAHRPVAAVAGRKRRLLMGGPIFACCLLIDGFEFEPMCLPSTSDMMFYLLYILEPIICK
jgi:hypothetical protein